eukprot:m.113915 g.113915  ORF g.113915 m.113915 type:complete len:259 (+) comp10821_c0_seq1:267-1043(+)
MLTEGGLVAVVLLVTMLAVAIAAICTFMCRRHRSKSVRLDTTVFKRLVPASKRDSTPGGGQDYVDGAEWMDNVHENDDEPVPELPRASSRSSSQRSSTASSPKSVAQFAEEIGTRSVETHATLIIPNGLRLLKTCKALITRLTATVIDFTSSESGKGLVVGSRDEIVSCAKMVSESVDALTKSMYPPIDDADILTNATELVNAAEELVLVSKFNCKQDKLDWLDKATKDVLHDFKVLVDSVQKYRNLHKNVAEFISDA